MASHISTIYNPQIGVEMEEGGVQRRVQSTPAAATEAANDAEAAMMYCRDEILPQLDSIDHYVIRPALEFQEIVKVISKTIVKRNHKLIDYDRHRVSLNKLTAKAERTLSEEKSIFKVQSQLETATQDYDYLNNALKAQLPAFFRLQYEFIQPIFEHMFHLQCKIFGMIYARCYELLTANEAHFVTHAMSVDEGFRWRIAQFNAQAEIENMDLLKSGGKAWLSVSGGANSSKLTLQERAAIKNESPAPMAIAQQPYQTYQPQKQQQPQHQLYPSQQDEKKSYGQTPSYGRAPSYGQSPHTHDEPSAPSFGKAPAPHYEPTPAPAYSQAPPYEHNQHHSYGSQNSAGSGMVSSRTAAPPPPPPSRINYVLALYDYDAQAQGDLSFRKDDKIELIKRTSDANDWWTGKLRNNIGVFPGNYVSEL
ncbi:uncharacterized protein EV154DRAFT_540912 [Mucor mucedo]|uniref:uncharacterized protein n=1 Tax=Mucor mucedo TaxID=29922 RepID=UPI0022203EB3|nr:uncharacterized protein EV154DRAFT_540912 [Mucor mucedo]KAI7867905.1 hypothetical protein EV154DRAFT_540912 [Mucor mucedo]